MRTGHCPHLRFLESDDKPQALYEKARQATLVHQAYVSEELTNNLQAHGAAGLFLDPERAILASPLRQPRTSNRRNNALHQAHLSNRAFETIATSLAESVGVMATARIQYVNKKTVLRVLTKAGAHCAMVSYALLQNLSVSECQLDEMWSFVGKKQQNLEPLEKLRQSMGDIWFWIAFDAVNKLVFAYVVGKRTLPHAVSLLREVKRVTAHMPELFSSDQLDHYANALLQVYGEVIWPERKPGPGRPPNPRLIPPEDLLYAQVVKRYEKNRVAEVTRKVIFGDPRRVESILAASPVSHTINTSYVERNNGTIRHMDARCVRKTLRFSKIKQNHEHQLSLTLAYYHLCRPHKTLTKRHGQPTTPFMAAGITDHVWTMHELLSFRPEIHCR